MWQLSYRTGQCGFVAGTWVLLEGVLFVWKVWTLFIVPCLLLAEATHGTADGILAVLVCCNNRISLQQTYLTFTNLTFTVIVSRNVGETFDCTEITIAGSE